MTLSDEVKALLVADGTLAAAMPSNIYTYAETGRLGISKDSTPNAFTSGILKPSAVVKQRDRVPDHQIIDVGTQRQSYRAVFEIWLYTNGSAPAPTTADRVYTVLEGKYLTVGRLHWIHEIEDRDPAMDHANFIRLDFELAAIRS